MSPEQIAASLGAFGTFIVGLYGAYRLAKADRYKASADNAALLLTGWKELQQSIAAEVERVKKSCAEQIEQLKEEHEIDRNEWYEERQRMREEHAQERQELREEIDILKAQVYALMALNKPRTPNARTRRTDKTKE